MRSPQNTESSEVVKFYCCGNHLSQWQMISQLSKSLRMDIMWEVHKRTRQEVSAKLEFYIYKTCLVRATNKLSLPYCPCYNLMSISFSTQGHHVVYMCPNVIFQILLPCSRLMTSHNVTCHVTAVSHASSSSKRKNKIKEK